MIYLRFPNVPPNSTSGKFIKQLKKDNELNMNNVFKANEFYAQIE